MSALNWPLLIPASVEARRAHLFQGGDASIRQPSTDPFLYQPQLKQGEHTCFRGVKQCTRAGENRTSSGKMGRGIV